MDASSRLQIPDHSVAGPSQSSRQTGSSRPVSATVLSTSTIPGTPSHGGSPSARKRASHTVTSQQQPQEQPIYRDVYSHPAAVAYAAAHPRRTIPKFGPYLLLQTLGEGEFGKVKLGLHGQWGEEVAVKLIRRGNIDTAVRMSKVEREIEVLRTIKHPNIVRLYDVIETDKYIGIILEYASGGELFDHILAHRYLKEKDACKLFSQLVSGVWYIHQKKIVHRDLKLENLLLDRHRNVIITDFGFANRFEHRQDDLMQTSCGSPCYAAPELVISEGLYVGSAVDIWSCGVILYAMLAGYLPFDDDPANPDGDNINLLYKYIVNTPLTFPDYVSAEARELLSMMLVPDPQRRADLTMIMAHRWLAPYQHLFERSVQDMERAAMEQHQLKRLAYQRQMKQQTGVTASPGSIQRSQSARIEAAQSGSSRSRQPPPAIPDFQYETAADVTISSPPPLPVQPSSRRQVASAIVMPTMSHAVSDDDPFAPSPSQETPTSPADEVALQGSMRGEPRARRSRESTSRSAKKASAPITAPVKNSPERRKTDRQRHTIQLEYPGEEEAVPMPSPHGRQPARERPWEPALHLDADADIPASPTVVSDAVHNGVATGSLRGRRTPKKASSAADPGATPKASKPLPTPPSSPPADTPTSKGSYTQPKAVSTQGSKGDLETPFIVTPERPSVSAPPVGAIDTQTPSAPPTPDGKVDLVQTSSASTGSAGSGSSRGRHRKGLSMDKVVGVLWRSASGSESKLGHGSVNGKSRVPSGISVPTPTASPTNGKSPTVSLQSETSTTYSKDSKKRRNTLTVMVEPFSRQIRQRTKGRSVAGDASPKTKEKEVPVIVEAKVKPDMPPPAFTTSRRSRTTSIGLGIPASTSKASSVMQWFRNKSKGRSSSDIIDDFENITPQEAEAPTERSTTPTINTYKSTVGPTSSSDTVNHASVQVVVTTPTSSEGPKSGRSPSLSRPSPSAASDASIPPTPNVSLSQRAITVWSNLSSVAAVPSVASRGAFNKTALRVHHGAVDQTTVTSGSPPDVMAHVTKVLLDMGMEVQQESEFKYRCIRPKRKKSALAGSSAGGLAAFTMVGSAASNGVDKRGLPVPSPSFTSTGGMLRGLLMRRQSSQVSAASSHPQPSIDSDTSADITVVSKPSREAISTLSSTTTEALYGDRAQDQGGEVRFSVELTRIDGLDDTFSLDIRRLKGSLRSYKYLYDTVRERCDLQR